MTRLIIAGGGLAGGLCALAMARKRPDVELVVVEQGERFGGNHTWSFFDSDVPAHRQWVLDGVGRHHWPEHEVRFPHRRRTIALGYNSIKSAALDAALRQGLRPEQFRFGARIAEVGPRSVTLEGGEKIEGDAVLDARGPGPMPGIELGWQKFVGRTYRFATPHRVEAPVIMNATVEQIDGYRFIYQLPLSATELLVEDTYYSVSPLLDEGVLGERVDAVAAAIGAARIADEEKGALPVVMGGAVQALWQGERVTKLGLRGGFFQPTTSYSLPDAVANAALLAEQRDFSAEALFALFRDRAQKLWQERSFFRLLNRMLFRAAEPAQSYRVLEHFYRLPPAVIARFYGSRLTAFDKVRILSGRPPVPIGRAIAALRSNAA